MLMMIQKKSTMKSANHHLILNNLWGSSKVPQENLLAVRSIVTIVALRHCKHSATRALPHSHLTHLMKFSAEHRRLHRHVGMVVSWQFFC